MKNNDLDWNRARAFLITAEQGSLSKAAVEMGVSQPTVGRQIAALEEELGVLLFDRVGNHLNLTARGRELLPALREMQRSAEQVMIAAQSNAQSLEGHVTVTVGDNFAAQYIPAILLKARSEAPKISVEIRAANQIEDIARREADIAIRHLRPVQNELIAKRLCMMQARLYAHQSLFEQFGIPRSTADLEDFPLVGFGRAPDIIGEMQALGIPASPANLRYSSESGIVAWEMAKAGLGACFMADRIAVGTPEMAPLLEADTHVEFPVWLVTHKELHTNKRIRLIFDLIAEFFEAL